MQKKKSKYIGALAGKGKQIYRCMQVDTYISKNKSVLSGIWLGNRWRATHYGYCCGSAQDVGEAD